MNFSTKLCEIFNRMKKFLNFLIPKEKKFFALFKRASENLIDSSELLMVLMRENDTSKWEEIRNKIVEKEHIGDTITHDILRELSTSFITPFDREDIHELAVVIDDIVDYINGSASRMVIYKADIITNEMIDLASLINQASKAIHKAVCQLNKMDLGNIIHDAYVDVNRIENEADDIFDSALGRLFAEEKDPIRLIKYKEIYAALETATDMAEDAANIIKSIQVKNA